MSDQHIYTMRRNCRNSDKMPEKNNLPELQTKTGTFYSPGGRNSSDVQEVQKRHRYQLLAHKRGLSNSFDDEFDEDVQVCAETSQKRRTDSTTTQAPETKDISKSIITADYYGIPYSLPYGDASGLWALRKRRKYELLARYRRISDLINLKEGDFKAKDDAISCQLDATEDSLVNMFSKMIINTIQQRKTSSISSKDSSGLWAHRKNRRYKLLAHYRGISESIAKEQMETKGSSTEEPAIVRKVIIRRCGNNQGSLPQKHPSGLWELRGSRWEQKYDKMAHGSNRTATTRQRGQDKHNPENKKMNVTHKTFNVRQQSNGRQLSRPGPQGNRPWTRSATSGQSERNRRGITHRPRRNQGSFAHRYSSSRWAQRGPRWRQNYDHMGLTNNHMATFKQNNLMNVSHKRFNAPQHLNRGSNHYADFSQTQSRRTHPRHRVHPRYNRWNYGGACQRRLPPTNSYQATTEAGKPTPGTQSNICCQCHRYVNNKRFKPKKGRKLNPQHQTC